MCPKVKPFNKLGVFANCRHKNMKRKSETVSFRLPLDLLQLLDKECGAFNISRGDFARTVLTNRLTAAEEETRKVEAGKLLTILESVRSEVKMNERKLARLLFLLLTTPANISADEARKITKEQFLRHS